MKNLITTIPQRGDLRHWIDVKKVLMECDSEFDFWTFSCAHFPIQNGPGALCYMVHSGFVRGYFTVIEFFDTPVYRWGVNQSKPEVYEGNKVKLAVWRPIQPIPMVGFQGWRYTDLRL